MVLLSIIVIADTMLSHAPTLSNTVTIWWITHTVIISLSPFPWQLSFYSKIMERSIILYTVGLEIPRGLL